MHQKESNSSGTLTLNLHFTLKLLDLKFFIQTQKKTPEPVGSVPPRISSGDKTRTVEVNLNASVTMLCPMQSLPVAIFRYIQRSLKLKPC